MKALSRAIGGFIIAIIGTFVIAFGGASNTPKWLGKSERGDD
jgi:hypothetical protein